MKALFEVLRQPAEESDMAGIALYVLSGKSRLYGDILAGSTRFLATRVKLRQYGVEVYQWRWREAGDGTEDDAERLATCDGICKDLIVTKAHVKEFAR